MYLAKTWSFNPSTQKTCSWAILLLIGIALSHCSRPSNNGKVSDASKNHLEHLIQRGDDAKLFGALKHLHPGERSKMMPVLFARFVERQTHRATQHMVSRDPIRAFASIDSLFEFPFAPEYLGSLQFGSYENASLSPRLPADKLSTALDLYLETYLSYRDQAAAEMPYRSRADLCATILPRIDGKNLSWQKYQLQMRAEALVVAQNVNALRLFLKDSSLTKTDKDFVLLDTTRPTPRSAAVALATVLRYMPPSDFLRDSLAVELEGRHLSRLSRNLFFLWYSRVMPTLMSFGVNTNLLEWTAAFARHAFTDVRSTSSEGLPRYNPVAIAWAADNLVPDPTHTVGEVASKKLYNLIAPELRIAALCHAHLAGGNIYDREAKAYADAAKKEGFRAPEYLRNRFGYLSFSKEAPTQNLPLYLGFWLRRHIDGSTGMTWAFLSKILLMYDAEWYTSALGIGGLSLPEVSNLYGKSLLTEIRTLDAQEGQKSNQMEKRRLIFHRRLRWSDFVSRDDLSRSQVMVAPQKEGGIGELDSVVCTIYASGVMAADRRQGTSYLLFGKFRSTPNGLRPEMSRAEALQILGAPAIEKPNYLFYEADGGPIHVYFNGAGLYRILLARR